MDWNKPLEKIARTNPSLDIRTDRLSRWLYATDASIYELIPAGVAFPKNTDEVQQLVVLCANEGIPLIPRGAGSGLGGGAIGEGLIIDLSRYMRNISKVNKEEQSIWVDAGTVLDNLNEFVKPVGLMFGPDVATSSRATIGGMIANNSSGAFVHHYGVTIDHVQAIEIITSTGERQIFDKDTPETWKKLETIADLVKPHISEIETLFHDGIKKRWPGYALDRYCKNLPCPVPLFGGSEGTLGIITRAKLNLVPIPGQRTLIVFMFNTMEGAMNAIIPLMNFQPASIEHIDDILFNQTRGQRNFEPVRQLLGLDSEQYKSLLFVEFFDPPQDIINEVLNLKLGQNSLYCKDVQQRNMLWEFRKAGLSLLTGMKGSAKPATGVEDTAVRPEDLHLYVQELSEVMNRYEVQASFYGHASAGLLHVRPVLDLHEPADIKKFRKLAEDVFALVRKYRGTFTGEHGVGMAHSEFMKEQIGENLFQLMAQIKHTLDPQCLMNPGKITDLSRFRFDENLRWRKLTLPFEPCLAFSAKDDSFIGNLEQCNGCGACRKETPTMCPTYIARGEEILSTRGRANIIRHVIEESAHNPNILHSSELEQALKYCLACRACTVECPSNVNMSLLKAELLHALDTKYLPRLTRFLLSNIDTFGKIASLTPSLANFSLKNKWLRNILERFSGIIAERPLPLYAREPFHRWFYKTYNGWKTSNGTRGTIILWDDCFTRYHEPDIGKDAVKVLTSAGFRVEILPDRSCCGRPSFSVGNLENTRKKGEQNLSILKDRKEPILFLEPSCFTMFYEDYKELKLESAEMVAENSMLLEEFLVNLLDSDSSALSFSHNKSMQIAIHTHCHTKATRGSAPMKEVLSHIPNAQVQILPSACCGMAGAYGITKDTYELSMDVGKHLKELIEKLPNSIKVIASGTSCRQQISYITNRKAEHFIQVLAQTIN